MLIWPAGQALCDQREANAAFCAKRGRRGAKNEALINFSPPFVSRFAQRSPRMANKAHIMQANADLTHDLTHNS